MKTKVSIGLVVAVHTAIPPLGRLRQEELTFGVSLGYIAGLCLKTHT